MYQFEKRDIRLRTNIYDGMYLKWQEDGKIGTFNRYVAMVLTMLAKRDEPIDELTDYVNYNDSPSLSIELDRNSPLTELTNTEINSLLSAYLEQYEIVFTDSRTRFNLANSLSDIFTTGNFGDKQAPWYKPERWVYLLTHGQNLHTLSTVNLGQIVAKHVIRKQLWSQLLRMSILLINMIVFALLITVPNLTDSSLYNINTITASSTTTTLFAILTSFVLLEIITSFQKSLLNRLIAITGILSLVSFVKDNVPMTENWWLVTTSSLTILTLLIWLIWLSVILMSVIHEAIDFIGTLLHPDLSKSQSASLNLFTFGSKKRELAMQNFSVVGQKTLFWHGQLGKITEAILDFDENTNLVCVSAVSSVSSSNLETEDTKSETNPENKNSEN